MKKIVISIIGIIILSAVIWYCLYNINDHAKKIPFSNENELLAVVYLGGLERDYDYSIVNKYFASSDINKFKVIELGGEECYLIVPRYKIGVNINKLTMGEEGETLTEFVTTAKEPFFLKCNMSDIFSNSEITFEYKDREYKYSPYLSLKDGSVVVEDFVYLLDK